MGFFSSISFLMISVIIYLPFLFKTAKISLLPDFLFAPLQTPPDIFKNNIQHVISIPTILSIH